jgi:hypothetical protein
MTLHAGAQSQQNPTAYDGFRSPQWARDG